MEFCIRDDDTSFFTSPDDLERAYGEISQKGPVSLAIIPFCRAGGSKCVPLAYRNQWSVHPLHENESLVEYLRHRIREGRFEAMLHGFHHDEPAGRPEFTVAAHLRRKVAEGRRYLEQVLQTSVRVFVPPHNAIGRDGLRAVAAEGLHLGGAAGLRSGWSLGSHRAWATWLRLRSWRLAGGRGIPWILDLQDHREIPGVAITPVSSFDQNAAALDCALADGSVFCAATHYWELQAPSLHPQDGTVGEHLGRLLIGRWPPTAWYGAPLATSSLTRQQPSDMCGFFAVFQTAPIVRLEHARKALDSIAHRGPDAAGEWTEGEVFLGHRRLSIIDLASGAQPMSSADGRYVVVFNGEIYNFQELRAALAHEGVRFRTQSDTEVLVEGYVHWGPSHSTV